MIWNKKKMEICFIIICYGHWKGRNVDLELLKLLRKTKKKIVWIIIKRKT